ncbi:Holliday junction branch migration protein RuvA [Pelodictyon phaeoclathratiforme]|jgi:Holliday junction DNA helicase RuvA|uniref:Holliday junction branch migration complex subunit RuvA n=1 Tax=Pelodictyon phaeoclathratiforme (strain DSM 5477 / BU-1) TaxID=324925 RepID=RUVA_PELPB|nr:Holliday junction branch migration protein RuvA [Pelodictyon phaeoclathratiforme]B4SCR7.1 RecName: Full=Holliday junction branch migration complex subunit RuvA [Pelodictyon phaeoclathratiforme BU-1]ACF42751.1 Holliday junction DNA helicase RuvA [Pelodictyon phaeoclathratiforme BU-1]MBV5289723.1 Holliday junction branch migration protein RuvA [Pelodictyon phaeoclathratiforme]
MFAYFRGKLTSVLPEEVVVEVSGIAYQFLISAATHRQLPEQGSEVFLFSHLVVREDLLQLYGFSGEEERQLFRLLLLTTGVGPKLALALLSGLSVQDIHDAILTNTPERLYGITGVGKKTAARIILELRDKVLKLSPVSALASPARLSSTLLRDDAVNALVTLGFSRIIVQKAVVAILEQNPGLTVEEVIKAALVSIHNS